MQEKWKEEKEREIRKKERKKEKERKMLNLTSYFNSWVDQATAKVPKSMLHKNAETSFRWKCRKFF